MKKLLRAFALTLTLALCLSLPVTAQAHEHYSMGDTVHDFTVTTPEGETITLSGLLEEYNGVLINFWYDGCGWCDYEFPFLQEAYEVYGNEIAVLALSPYDNDEAIAAYKAANGLTFPMATDTVGLTDSFYVSGFPTSVMIDRFGVVCFKESGAQQSTDAFMGLMEGFVGDDYTESKLNYFIPGPKPTIDNPAPEAVAAAVNADGAALTWTASETNRAWPWLPAERDGRTVIVTSNAGQHSTAAEVSTTVAANAGDVLAFDLNVSSESGYDYFILKVNGEVVKAFSGIMDWFSYAYAFDAAGEYEIAFAFEKDYIGEAGEDMAALDNVRLLSGGEAAAAVAPNPFRPAPLAGDAFALSLVSDAAKPVKILNSAGEALTDFVGAPTEGFYIVEDADATVRIQLGEDIDPDTVMISTARTSGVVTMCDVAEDGYYFTIGLTDPAEAEEGNVPFYIYEGEEPFVPMYLYTDVRENTEIDTSIVIFPGEEGMEIFCQSYGGYIGDTLTWAYADADPESVQIPTEVEYELTFVDESFAPLSGVMANVCDDSTCMVIITDENGRAVFTAKPYAYDLHVIKAPDGYDVSADDGWKLPRAGGSVEIMLEKGE